MARSENVEKVKRVNIDQGIYEYVKAQLVPKLDKKEISKFVRNAILFSGEAFDQSPFLYKLVWDRWTGCNELDGIVTSSIPFRLQESVEAWAGRIQRSLDSNFTSFVVRCILFYLPFYRSFPASMVTIYPEWLESQSKKCRPVPHQTSIGQGQDCRTCVERCQQKSA